MNKKLKVLEPEKRVGLVVVITGEGKGKTTAALGMVLRAVGHGMRVCIVHFIKGNTYSGEYDAVQMLPNVDLHIVGKGFVRGRLDAHRAAAQEGIKLALDKVTSGNYDIVMLDEINNALRLKLVGLEQVLELIDKKPPLVHLILTGRDAHPEIIERAHTVSEVSEIKHAYKLGIEPQKGIDY